MIHLVCLKCCTIQMLQWSYTKCSCLICAFDKRYANRHKAWWPQNQTTRNWCLSGLMQEDAQTMKWDCIPVKQPNTFTAFVSLLCDVAVACIECLLALSGGLKIYNVIVLFFLIVFLYYNHFQQIVSLLLLNLSLHVWSEKEEVQTETFESLKCWHIYYTYITKTHALIIVHQDFG